MEPAPKRGETSSAPIRPGIGDNWRMAVRIKMPPDVRLAILIAVAVMAVFVGLYSLELAIPKRDYFIERHGTLVTADVTEASTDGIVQKLIRLESTTGLRVNMRVVRPQTEPGATLPVIIVMGGEGTGKDAVDLVGKPKGVAYLALDYPYEGDQELDAFWESLTAIPGIQQAFLDSPPAMSLALDWALQQTWVDPDKVELVGASLGVPFTAVAGALDDRFTRVWLLHGGAENVPWVMHVGKRYVENEFLRGSLARAALLLVYGNSFETLDWIPQIAPRPLVIVAARDDDFVPPEAQQPFVAAAETSEHIEIVWTEGRHIRPTRREELQQLLDIVLSRIDYGEPAE
jgi:cephalosporin-C deacetylase-like acetyl esterase